MKMKMRQGEKAADRPNDEGGRRGQLILGEHSAGQILSYDKQKM